MSAERLDPNACGVSQAGLLATESASALGLRLTGGSVRLAFPVVNPQWPDSAKRDRREPPAITLSAAVRPLFFSLAVAGGTRIDNPIAAVGAALDGSAMIPI